MGRKWAYRPSLLTIISVVWRWNWAHNSRFSNSIVTPEFASYFIGQSPATLTHSCKDGAKWREEREGEEWEEDKVDTRDGNGRGWGLGGEGGGDAEGREDGVPVHGSCGLGRSSVWPQVRVSEVGIMARLERGADCGVEQWWGH